VNSISATQDGLTTADDIAAAQPLLPGHTRWAAIKGGSRAQFGWYGRHSGDGTEIVDYVQAPTFLDGLRQHIAAWQPDRLFTMEASEWLESRFQQTRLAAAAGMATALLPNTQFLVGYFDLYADSWKGLCARSWVGGSTSTGSIGG
jgi:hypothetical protein